MKNTIYILFITLITSYCNAQEYEILFKVDASEEKSIKTLGLRGNTKPLSWKEGYPMTDEDGDGIYEATVKFKTSSKNLRYKFTIDKRLELEGSDNRTLWFKKGEKTIAEHIYNEYNFHNKETVEKLVYSSAQIKEDISILRNTLNFIHPNLYRYRDSLSLDKDFVTLENELLENPSIKQVYGRVSKLAAKIKCSHTFTNPWNQGINVKKSIFFQPDKLPFTFKRIGKRIFIDRNASESDKLKKRLEIVSINNIPTQEIMTRLAHYITSDGNNYEKKLQRLTLNGTSKFELFDIFYPLEFGSKTKFDVQHIDYQTKDTITTTVSALSKTKRSAILNERYPSYTNSFEDGWKLEILNAETALLKINSFAVFSSDFDWKKFIDISFNTIEQRDIKNFIIDIRENEGGDTEVAEYLVERMISKPITLKIPSQTTHYRKIPEEIKKHISTWEERPYDWGKKVKYIGNGKYELESSFMATSKTFRPKKNSFKGNIFMLIDAENSSATHITATYAKKYGIATLVGQETGGNQKGLNGGYLFFLRLPNSKVEIDVPVFGINILEETQETYDGGIVPDVLVQKSVDDLIRGVDTELEKVLELIANKN